jgi:hypothetical protein
MVLFAFLQEMDLPGTTLMVLVTKTMGLCNETSQISQRRSIHCRISVDEGLIRPKHVVPTGTASGAATKSN